MIWNRESTVNVILFLLSEIEWLIVFSKRKLLSYLTPVYKSFREISSSSLKSMLIANSRCPSKKIKVFFDSDK